MRPVMGGLLGGDYNSLTPIVTNFWQDESPLSRWERAG